MHNTSLVKCDLLEIGNLHLADDPSGSLTKNSLNRRTKM